MTCSARRRPVNAVNAVNATWATSASDTHRPACSSHTACEYWIGVQVPSSMAAIAASTVGVWRRVTENRAPARRAAATTAWA